MPRLGGAVLDALAAFGWAVLSKLRRNGHRLRHTMDQVIETKIKIKSDQELHSIYSCKARQPPSTLSCTALCLILTVVMALEPVDAYHSQCRR